MIVIILYASVRSLNRTSKAIGVRVYGLQQLPRCGRDNATGVSWPITREQGGVNQCNCTPLILIGLAGYELNMRIYC